jgi:hypothetical protein
MTWIRFEGIVRSLPHHLSPYSGTPSEQARRLSSDVRIREGGVKVTGVLGLGGNTRPLFRTFAPVSSEQIVR